MPVHQKLIICSSWFTINCPLKLNVGNCWHVYGGVAAKEFGLTDTINSKELSKPVQEVLLEEQQIQRKASFLFCTIWATDLFVLVPESFSGGISNNNWDFWTRWFLRWQMEEFGTALTALAKVVLSLQHWNQHRRFVSIFHVVILGKCFSWINWICVVSENQTKILMSSNSWHFSVLSAGYLWNYWLRQMWKHWPLVFI
jgi:hypothetical protein